MEITDPPQYAQLFDQLSVFTCFRSRRPSTWAVLHDQDMAENRVCKPQLDSREEAGVLYGQPTTSRMHKDLGIDVLPLAEIIITFIES